MQAECQQTMTTAAIEEQIAHYVHMQMVFTFLLQ